MNKTWLALILIVFTSGQVGPESWSIYHHNGYQMTAGLFCGLVPQISEHRGAAL